MKEDGPNESVQEYQCQLVEDMFTVRDQQLQNRDNGGTTDPGACVIVVTSDTNGCDGSGFVVGSPTHIGEPICHVTRYCEGCWLAEL